MKGEEGEITKRGGHPRGDKHKTLSAKEFQAELAKPTTLAFLECLTLTPDATNGSAILHVRGVLSPDHRKMERADPMEYHFQASSSDLVESLRGCLDHLEGGTPEDRIADSLERIEKHLEKIVSFYDST